MIVKNDKKLIYYSNAENQLFDLTKDPDELNSIKNSTLERHLVNELILQLGEHPDAIATRVETYNRNSFIQWKNEQGKDYVENISNLISKNIRIETCSLLKIGSLYHL